MLLNGARAGIALPPDHDLRIAVGKVALHDRRVSPLRDRSMKPCAVRVAAVVEQRVDPVATAKGLHLCKFALLAGPDAHEASLHGRRIHPRHTAVRIIAPSNEQPAVSLVDEQGRSSDDVDSRADRRPARRRTDPPTGPAPAAGEQQAPLLASPVLRRGPTARRRRRVRRGALSPADLFSEALVRSPACRSRESLLRRHTRTVAWRRCRCHPPLPGTYRHSPVRRTRWRHGPGTAV
jgi:hypothetical protein